VLPRARRYQYFMTDVTTKTVLITGAVRRIGRTLAEHLARDGWTVGIHFHGASTEADAVVEGIKRAGGQAAAVAADLADAKAVDTLIARTVAVLGPLGALINNASIFERDEIGGITAQSWDSHLDINLRAPLFLSQAFAAQVPGPGRGAIINILDERVWSLTPHFVSYTVSKAGLWTLTQTLALALAPRIRVNGIGPGPTLPSPRQSQAQFDAQAQSMPLGHGTTPGEIADAARYILAAPSMTGQMIALDGGQHLAWGQVKSGTAPED